MDKLKNLNLFINKGENHLENTPLINGNVNKES